jgi:hypothetical protein
MHFAASCLFAIILGLLVSNAVVAADDDFLSAIEAESEKVGSRHAPEEQLPAKNADGAEDENVARSLDEFEQLLEERYRGSYVFFSKLPERSREEIFQEYQRGMPIGKIRKKIVDRYLQR